MADTAYRAGDYSTDPANNNSTAPNGAPEGMAPSGVNDAMRELAARLAFNHGDRDIYDATDTGSANSYICQITGANVGLNAGMTVKFKAANANSGASTLQVNSLTAKAIRKANDAALVSGDILANQIVECVYDATLDHWLMTSPTGNSTNNALSGLTASATELNEQVVSFFIADGSLDKTYYIRMPHAGTVSKIQTTIDDVVSTADITLTARIGVTAMTDGVVTIATAGSAVGDTDEATPSANNTVSAGTVMNLVVTGGGSGGAPGIHVLIFVTR